ncbi:uncharacterized protein LOC125031662 [Penaeus chinensis]|uniref:uncharacterized protein LOC125031662 n=1 Tax=Penaeus chinensis TaxID=139456 RepID=UPI001FB5A431|nr:uncharacterized protein LOC125031662 [Penaeus chinensis]
MVSACSGDVEAERKEMVGVRSGDVAENKKWVDRHPVEDSSTDLEYDFEMKWDYSDFQTLEDISEESDLDIESAMLYPSIRIIRWWTGNHWSRPGIHHQINTGDAKLTCIRQWTLPYATKQTIHQQCDSMLQAGVIEPSTSPWLSPTVLVKKRDSSLRFCVDYRALTTVTVKDTYSLPRVDAYLMN